MAPRRVLVVAQAFKETLAPAEVARAVAGAARAARLEPAVLVGSDGGDGLLEALSPQLTRRTTHSCEDPLGRALEAEVGWLDERTAVVESRLACGLGLLRPGERDPLVTTTRGVGMLIGEAVGAGAETVYVGLGGSATMDGGLGMARAWGWRARDVAGVELPEGGGALADLARLDPGRRPEARLVGLCDVRNPLTGPRGAGVYAAQKGADAAAERRLAAGLERLAELALEEGRAGLEGLAGAGAAGGLGFGLLFFGAGRLEAGAAWVLDRLGVDELLRGADMVVVGEGAFDGTSLEGKLTGEVLRRAAAAAVPVLLLAPSAAEVPGDVLVESGGGLWTAQELGRRAARGIERAVRLWAL